MTSGEIKLQINVLNVENSHKVANKIFNYV